MVQQFLSLPHHGFELYKPVLGKALVTKTDVLRNGKLIHHFKLLVYLGYARGSWPTPVLIFRTSSPLIKIVPGIFRINAREHFHQCTFSGAIFADKGHRLAGTHCKINVLQRLDRAE